MKRLKQILTIILGFSTLVFSSGVYADLQEQSETQVDFTFNPTLEMVLSSDTLAILDMVPGQALASGDMTITVTTNNVAGYKLSASVGNAANPSSNLTLSTNSYFESLATDASLALNAFGAGSKWGYSTNEGTSYSGLPVYTGIAKEIKATTGSDDASTTKFRIGASSVNGQASGIYTNVVNFTAVTNVVTSN